MRPASSSKRATITDVAHSAGVSTSAVSKVLRNAYGVSPAMRERVQTAMDELGYRPHAAARGMRGRTYTIGVLLASIRNAFYADLLDGVNAALRDTEYALFLGSGGSSEREDQTRLIHAMVDRQMDGLILIAPTVSRSEVVHIAAEVPTVVVGHHDPSPAYDCVVNQDGVGVDLVVDHLVALGHRDMAHLSHPTVRGTQWEQRPEHHVRAAYRAAMARHGLADLARVVHSGYSDEGGYRGAMELLTSTRPPTAIFAGADVAATGVFRAAAELGLRIPDDLSLAGYNNTSVAALAPVNLTSVDQAGAMMGETAARLLLERIEKRRDRAVVMASTPHLVVRGSTAPPPAA
ncbi:LacI family DNA-binding transcriptional regulator [Streptomyces resistomycificus]|uniref:LacI family transcriptional regulator n=1 Tax=Streptomyces resistomycificus TaxID=67356 RepID=A0A0L8KZH8_9ACTN|nr:LacI family DNA-binding transcriptional regulator [Streptomyces resistomycificus]KOG31342.1 LacI family transcriptional regulator [Streptomyces resistomycificus]KUN94306.1 LacI family transcriptional regulator [Streptomyces resistomycificus]